MAGIGFLRFIYHCMETKPAKSSCQFKSLLSVDAPISVICSQVERYSSAQVLENERVVLECLATYLGEC